MRGWVLPLPHRLLLLLPLLRVKVRRSQHPSPFSLSKIDALPQLSIHGLVVVLRLFLSYHYFRIGFREAVGDCVDWGDVGVSVILERSGGVRCLGGWDGEWESGKLDIGVGVFRLD